MTENKEITEEEFIEMFGCTQEEYDKILCENERRILQERDRVAEELDKLTDEEIDQITEEELRQLYKSREEYDKIWPKIIERLSNKKDCQKID